MPNRPSAVAVMQSLGFDPDPWQVEVLEGGHRRLLLNCCRQAGKSTVVTLLALVEALTVPFTKVLLVSKSHRQSRELFSIVRDCYRRMGQPCQERLTREELVLSNRSRIVSLPCREDTIRGYSRVNLLVIDEAARVPDDLYRAVRPMLAVSNGRLFCLSTPFGKRGFFYEAWMRGGDDWKRIEVPAEQIPRISKETLEEDLRELGEAMFRQEYCCSFESLEGLVYPDFSRCVTSAPAPKEGRLLGGMDFGFRNPFAAVWGIVDRDDVLWLTGEHYLRGKDLGYHIPFLPRKRVMWYADPSGANERATLARADFKVRPGNNALRAGIAAVSARLRQGLLRVVAGRCPNLLAEAALYRYRNGSDRDSEEPLYANNHALDALRYLVMGLDGDRAPRRPAAEAGSPEPASAKPPRDRWLRYDNEALWTRIFP